MSYEPVAQRFCMAVSINRGPFCGCPEPYFSGSVLGLLFLETPTFEECGPRILALSR